MKTILLLTDFSEKSQHAAEFAYQVASDVNADLLFFNTYYVPTGSIFAGIYTSYYSDYSGFQEESMKRLRFQADIVKEKFENIRSNKPPIILCENQIGNLSDNVKNLLDNREISMIVMGSKRTDAFLDHFLFGSETKRVIESADVPVMFVSEKTDYKDFKKIAFASAGFDKEDFKALNFITKLATPFNAQIIITHITPKKEEVLAGEVPKEIYLSWSEMEYENIAFYDVKSDDVSASIKKFSEIADIDLITLIYRKHKFFEQLFGESTIREMLKYDKVPLLIFPEKYFD
jgi:nucleotide-binding universal stress UspA family protein